MAPEIRTKVNNKNFKDHLVITFLHMELLGTWTTRWTEAPVSVLMQVLTCQHLLVL